jgi:hypothetical protein
MGPPNDDLPFDEDDEAAPGLEAAGAAVLRFTRLLQNLDWFGSVGLPLGSHEYDIAETYVSTLGFPDVAIAPVETWDDAAALAGGIEINDAAWDAEEQLRAALTQEATDRYGEEDLALILTHIASRTVPAISRAATAAARKARVRDEDLVRAAVGAASLASHQAALVLLSEADPDHPFAFKFRLVEAGRWPVGIIGGTLNLF